MAASRPRCSREQLGKAFDHYDMAKDGIADFAYVNPGCQPGRGDGRCRTAVHLCRHQGRLRGDRRVVPRLRAKGDEGRQVLLREIVHDPGTFHSKKRLPLPSDIKGLKVRPATSTIGQMVTLLGGTNVQASAPESRDMLERGVADAITFPWGSISLFGIDKDVTHHMDAPLYTTPFVWAMNKDT